MALVQRRLWDWRMVMALAMAVAIVFIIYTAITGQVKLDHERTANAAATQKLIDKLTTLEDTQGRTATVFEENQRRMLVYIEAQARRQAALLRYERAHGIKLPIRFLTPVPVPHLRPISTRHHSGSTSTSGTKTGTRNTTSAPPAPGKSGKHRHHRFHKRGQ